MSVSSRTVLHYLTGAIRCSRKVLINGKINNIRATSTRQEVALHLFEVGIMGLLKLPRLCLEVWTSCHESLTSNKPRHLRTPPRRWFTGPSEVCVFIIPQQALPSCREDRSFSFDLNDDNWEEMKTCTTDDAWQRLLRTVVSCHSSSISSSLHQQQIDSQSPELCRLHGIVKATQAHN